MKIAIRREMGGTKKFKGEVNHGQSWFMPACKTDMRKIDLTINVA